MPMKAALLLALLVLAPLAGADPGPQALLTASALRWQDGEASTGRLVAVQHHGASGLFQLDAATVHVHAVKTDAYAEPTPQAAYAGPWTYEESDHRDVHLLGMGGDAGAFLYVVPSPDGPSTLSTGCGEAQPADDAVPFQVPTPIETPNPNPVLDLGKALSVRACGAVSVCGAFTVVLWARDANGTSADGPLRLESGQLPRPGEPDARPVLGRAQQLYLAAQGCLSLMPTDATRILAEGLDLQGPSLLLRQGSGSVAGLGDVRADEMRLDGSLLGRAARADHRLSVAVTGADGIHLDGAAVRLAPPAGRDGPWLWWLLAAAPIPVVALAARRARDPERLLQRLEMAEAAKEHDRVVALADRLLRRQPGRVEALAARAESRLARGQHEGALDDSMAVLKQPLDPEVRAAVSILACRSSAFLGHLEQAVKFLGDAYADHPLTACRATASFPEVARLASSTGYS